MIKSIDNNSHAGIDLHEIQNFFSRLAKNCKEKVITTKTLLIFVAKSAQFEAITTDRLLNQYKMTSKKPITLEEFIDNISPLFDLSDDYIEENQLFAELNKNGSGYVDFDDVCKEINQYRSDLNAHGEIDSEIRKQTLEEAEKAHFDSNMIPLQLKVLKSSERRKMTYLTL